MSNPVQIVSAGVDTLVLNIYPTDSEGKVISRRIDSELQEELTLLKQRAQDEEEDIPTRFVFNGSNLLMRTKGSEGFNWILRNASLTLAVNRGSKMQMLGQVRFSSEYLWSVGNVDKAISDGALFLMSIFGDDLYLQISNCDLAVDVVFLDLGMVQTVKECFITRAQLDDERPLDAGEDGMLDGPDSIKRRWRRITGLSFGARTGAVSAVLYDKTHEIKYKSPNKQWFHDLWQSAAYEDGTPVWDGISPVWRIEVRFKRRALHEFKQEGIFHGIENAYDLKERIPGLWAYAVGHAGGGEDGLPDGWLRYVVPSEDTNRSRWPVHPDWQVIQGAFQAHPELETVEEQEAQEREELLQLVDEELAVRPWKTPTTRHAHCGTSSGTSPISSAGKMSSPPLKTTPIDLKPFIRQRKYEVNMRRMVAQIAGCAITAEAWRPRESEEVERDLSATFHFLYQHVEDYLEETARDFSKSVHKKRVLYSTETAFVA